MTLTKLQLSQHRPNSYSKPCTKYLIDFTEEVCSYIEQMDCALEQLDYKIEPIVRNFYQTESHNRLIELFHDKGWVNNPVDAGLAASEALYNLYPDLENKCKCVGFKVTDIEEVRINYHQSQDQAITCFAEVWVINREPNDGLRANPGALPRTR